MSTTVRQALGLMSSAGTGKLPAALLTRWSTGPSPCSTASKAAATASASRMSQAHAEGPAARQPRPTATPAARCALVAAHHGHRRAEPAELGGDRLAQSGAAAGHEDHAHRRRCRPGGPRHRWAGAGAGRAGSWATILSTHGTDAPGRLRHARAVATGRTGTLSGRQRSLPPTRRDPVRTCGPPPVGLVGCGDRSKDPNPARVTPPRRNRRSISP